MAAARVLLARADEPEPLRLLLQYGVSRATKELDPPLAPRRQGAAAESGEAAEDALAPAARVLAPPPPPPPPRVRGDAQLVETRARLLQYRERGDGRGAVRRGEQRGPPTTPP